VIPSSATSAHARHNALPSTSVTARSNPDRRHGAHQPNGSPGAGSTLVTPSSSRARHPGRMAWSNTSRRSDRYGREHRAERARRMAALRRAGSGVCAERVCVKRTRVIYPTDDLHLCHGPDGVTVIGLGHAACNLHEAAVRANRRMRARRRAQPRRQTTTRQSALRW
jgi:hypothetical protein